MQRIVASAALAAALLGCVSTASLQQPLDYPETLRGGVVEDYHGTRIADPYRWMEDLDAPAVADWVAAQNAVTTPYLAALPLQSHFRERLTALWSYTRTGIPQREAGRLFYTRNSGLQRQAPVYMRAAPDAEPGLVLDPNAISPDGSVSLAQYAPSPDAKLIAYALAQGGADWRTIRVRDIASGRDLADEVRWMRFSGIAWTRDGKGFFYSRYPEPPANKVLEAALSGHALYYHRIGTPQAEDVLVYERPDLAGWVLGGSVTEDGRYLLITLAEGAGNNNRLHYADLVDSAGAAHRRARCAPSWRATTPSTPRSATWARNSTCAPTGTRRTARSSPSTRARPIRRAGGSSCPSSRRHWRTWRSSAGASPLNTWSTSAAGCACSGSTARHRGRSRCRAWAACSG